jgi:ribonuclease HI
MSSESKVYFGFADGTSRHTQTLASTTWVIFTPGGQLLSSGGIFLGDAINNVIGYNVVIELLRDALPHDICHLQVYLYSQLVASQLNGVYCVYDPTLHQSFLRVRLLEHHFDYITYIHVPTRFNHMTDTLSNQILYCHVAHT